MKPLAAILGALGAIPVFVTSTAEALVVEEASKQRQRLRDWRSLTGLPDDVALPAFAAIRAEGLARALPMLGLDDRPIEVALCGYTAGRRATLEVRCADRRIAVKAFAQSPEPEARLYLALAGGCRGVHVPRLVSWDPELRVLATEWLEGPTLSSGIENGQGRRAGELAAMWLWRAPELPVGFGPHLGDESVLAKAGKWTEGLGAADGALGAVASAVARRLADTQPPARSAHLLHGSLYDRHVLDMGDGPGLIDWDCFGQGPAELDAAVFLSGVWRRGLRPRRQSESVRAIETFLACARGLLDERALAWHEAATLLRLAHKKTRRPDRDALAVAHRLLIEAARLVAE